MTFGADLSSGELSLRFSGVLNDELSGFYRSKYSVRGETRYMAITQHEATDARKTFPCVDEPAAKASYQITVEAPADRTVVSNMHALRVETSADGKRRTHTFAETPVMSTYLTAVCVPGTVHREGRVSAERLRNRQRVVYRRRATRARPQSAPPAH